MLFKKPLFFFIKYLLSVSLEKKNSLFLNIPILLFFLLGFPFLFLGCSLKEKNVSTPEKLYKKALSQKQEKNYPKALETLTQMREQFPYSSFNPKARLLLGDIYFMEEKYTVSAEVYKRFRLIHPHTKKAYVLNQLGLCYLRQLPSTPDRDISKADLALRYFRELLDLSIETPYKKEAAKHITFLLNLKAKKEFITASFYVKQGLQEAAFNRLNHVIQTYPESSVTSKALLSAYTLAKKLERDTESYKKRIKKDFPHLLK